MWLFQHQAQPVLHELKQKRINYNFDLEYRRLNFIHCDLKIHSVSVWGAKRRVYKYIWEECVDLGEIFCGIFSHALNLYKLDNPLQHFSWDIWWQYTRITVMWCARTRAFYLIRDTFYCVASSQAASVSCSEAIRWAFEWNKHFTGSLN